MTEPARTGTLAALARRVRDGSRTPLVALVGGQICLHSAMAGLRLATPLYVLRHGGSQWLAGVMIALFALAPVALAIPTGRWTDRRGYHKPVRLAVTLVVLGGAFAVGGVLLASWGEGASSSSAPSQWTWLCLALGATCSGAGCSVGLIAIQRTAGRIASRSTTAGLSPDGGAALKRVFSWLGLAPSLSNIVGPVLAGVLIDLGGFSLAMGTMAVMPLLVQWWARRVPAEAPVPRAADAHRRSALDLLRGPRIKLLLTVNWLLSTSWDVHTFLVPLLGHERGLSASATGLVLGVFAAAVSGVRLLIPMVADRLREHVVLAGAMLLAALSFAVYPFAHGALAMMACAAVLGLALGSVQPMIMTTLHQITPHERHGEAIALRSMLLNLSSTVMPLGFGIVSGAIGASGLFALAATMLAAGSVLPRRLNRSVPATSGPAA